MGFKRKGELTVAETARALGISGDTVRRWCHTMSAGKTIRPRGATKRLRIVRQDVSGFYYLNRSEVQAVADEVELLNNQTQ